MGPNGQDQDREERKELWWIYAPIHIGVPRLKKEVDNDDGDNDSMYIGEVLYIKFNNIFVPFLHM